MGDGGGGGGLNSAFAISHRGDQTNQGVKVRFYFGGLYGSSAAAARWRCGSGVAAVWNRAHRKYIMHRVAAA